ncbi:MAG: hypothetical protein JJ896_05110 [Rhodothermales bacterium]|nr:hypothetical protein [Rhodothermales bacterium]MBO6779012.1 hypothetical protein [Rhodothermales bacterium]
MHDAVRTMSILLVSLAATCDPALITSDEQVAEHPPQRNGCSLINLESCILDEHMSWWPIRADTVWTFDEVYQDSGLQRVVRGQGLATWQVGTESWNALPVGDSLVVAKSFDLVELRRGTFSGSMTSGPFEGTYDESNEIRLDWYFVEPDSGRYALGFVGRDFGATLFHFRIPPSVDSAAVAEGKPDGNGNNLAPSFGGEVVLLHGLGVSSLTTVQGVKYSTRRTLNRR